MRITPDLLVLADNAALILPLHRDLDMARDYGRLLGIVDALVARSGSAGTGATRR